jgi:hypothetical protein
VSAKHLHEMIIENFKNQIDLKMSYLDCNRILLDFHDHVTDYQFKSRVKGFQDQKLVTTFISKIADQHHMFNLERMLEDLIAIVS